MRIRTVLLWVCGTMLATGCGLHSTTGKTSAPPERSNEAPQKIAAPQKIDDQSPMMMSFGEVDYGPDFMMTAYDDTRPGSTGTDCAQIEEDLYNNYYTYCYPSIPPANKAYCDDINKKFNDAMMCNTRDKTSASGQSNCDYWKSMLDKYNTIAAGCTPVPAGKEKYCDYSVRKRDWFKARVATCPKPSPAPAPTGSPAPGPMTTPSPG